MKNPDELSRRQFLQATGAALAGLALPGVAVAAQAKPWLIHHYHTSTPGYPHNVYTKENWDVPGDPWRIRCVIRKNGKFIRFVYRKNGKFITKSEFYDAFIRLTHRWNLFTHGEVIDGVPVLHSYPKHSWIRMTRDA